MKTFVNIDFFLAARSEKSREKTSQRIQKALNDTFQEDVQRKEGEDYRYQTTLSAESWELTVFRILQACQSLGRQWLLTGDVDFELNAWSNQPIIIGVESIDVSIDNPTVIAPEIALSAPEI